MKPAETIKLAARAEPEQTEAEIRNTRAFFRIAAAGTSIGLGCMAATMEALRGRENSFAFEFSLRTLAAFAGGVAVGLIYWKLVTKGRWTARLASVALAILGLGAFLYPLRFVPPNVLKELAKGFIPAAFAITVVVAMLVAAMRFMEADSREEENRAERADSSREKK